MTERPRPVAASGAGLALRSGFKGVALVTPLPHTLIPSTSWGSRGSSASPEPGGPRNLGVPGAWGSPASPEPGGPRATRGSPAADREMTRVRLSWEACGVREAA